MSDPGTSETRHSLTQTRMGYRGVRARKAGEELLATGGCVQDFRRCSDKVAGASSSWGPCTHGTSPHSSQSEAAWSPGHAGRRCLSHNHHVKGVFCRRSSGTRTPGRERAWLPRAPAGAAVTGSRPRPRQQVGEDEEGHNQTHGHTAEKFSVVSPRPRHCGEAFHTPCEQTCHACEIRTLREESQ